MSPDRLHRLLHSPATHACTPLHTFVAQEASPPSGCLATSPGAGCCDDVVPDHLAGRSHSTTSAVRGLCQKTLIQRIAVLRRCPTSKRTLCRSRPTCTAQTVEMSTKIAKRQLREMSAMAAAHAGTGTPGKGVLASKSKGVYAPVSSSVSTVCFLLETSMHARNRGDPVGSSPYEVSQ